LPNFASVFDVGIIPFKINELTIACNPLKLLEYLSLGIPIVSVNLSEVRKFKSHVDIADNYDDFVNQIKMAVQKDTEQKRKERLSVAEKYSWESITQNICEKILFIEKNKNYIELQN
jgi:glycosyltransferase involved in cell wall biosynthesis